MKGIKTSKLAYILLGLGSVLGNVLIKITIGPQPKGIFKFCEKGDILALG